MVKNTKNYTFCDSLQFTPLPYMGDSVRFIASKILTSLLNTFIDLLGI